MLSEILATRLDESCTHQDFRNVFWIHQHKLLQESLMFWDKSTVVNFLNWSIHNNIQNLCRIVSKNSSSHQIMTNYTPTVLSATCIYIFPLLHFFFQTYFLKGIHVSLSNLELVRALYLVIKHNKKGTRSICLPEFAKFVSPVRHYQQNLDKFCQGLTQD